MGSAKKSQKEPKPRERLDLTEHQTAGLRKQVRRLCADLSRTGELLSALLEAHEVMRAQLDQVVAGQRRTNELLELSLGAALDLELEIPDPGR